MKHILEFFHDVIPIVFVVGIVAVAFVFYNQTRSLAAAGVEKTQAFESQLKTADVLVYDGMTVSGMEVKEFVKSFYKPAGQDGTFAITISSVNGDKAITNPEIPGVGNRESFLCTVKRKESIIQSVAFTKK